MELDSKKITDAMEDAIVAGVKKSFDSYHSELTRLMERVVGELVPELKPLLRDAIRECVDDPEFQQQIKSELRIVLAKELVKRFGGELQKQVNALKSNPATREQITEAIEGIMQSQMAQPT